MNLRAVFAVGVAAIGCGGTEPAASEDPPAPRDGRSSGSLSAEARTGLRKPRLERPDQDFTLIRPPPISVQSWSSTSPMQVGGGFGVSARLPDRRVLFAGGRIMSGGPYGPSARAQLFEPLTNTWSPVAPMSHPRFGASAAVLPDGKVLVTGGQSTSEVLASAEIYDPVADSWSPTGTMAAARQFHGSATLPDGRVMVFGGYSGGSPAVLSSAEIYDPATGLWSAAASLTAPRYAMATTALADGRVLVAGGYHHGVLASVEIYTPATDTTTDTWTPAAPLHLERSDAAAVTLPDARVLVVGGMVNDEESPPDAELFDPTTGLWTPTAPMLERRIHFGLTLLADGRVLAAGGYTALRTETFSPTTSLWSPSGQTTTVHMAPTITLLQDGRALLTAGYHGMSSEIFTP